MDFEKYKKIIQKHTWWSEECPGRAQYCYWMFSAVEQQQYLCPGLLSICSVLVKDGYVFEMTSEQEKLEQYYWLKRQYQENYGFIDDEHTRWLAIRDENNELAQRIINFKGKWSTEEILIAYNDLLDVAIQSTCYGFFLECIDIYSEQFLSKEIQKQFPELDVNQANEIALTMSAPVIVSFMEEFEIDKAQVILEYRQQLDKPNKTLDDQINELVSTYQTLSVNYAGSAPYTYDDILEQLQSAATTYSNEQLTEQIKNVEEKIETMTVKQDQLSAQYKFNQELLDDFSILRSIGGWMDERKQSMIQVSLAIRLLLQALSKLTEVSVGQLEWYTIEEINQLIEAQQKMDTTVIDSRERCSVFVTRYKRGTGSVLTIFTQDQAQEAHKLFFQRDKAPLKGTVASSAKQQFFTGEVQVVLDTAKDKFESGKILVTSMTRPDFVPLLKKATAIITDEGGLTCHAAVVARELGIPCIIGTKHASKDLKSGDKVEMNLVNGVIIAKP